MQIDNFKLGDKVRVVKVIDKHIFTLAEETKFLRTYLHKTGHIVKFDNVGYGASPRDPMILVEFRKKNVEAFWTEELTSSWGFKD